MERKICTNLAPFGQRVAKNYNQSQPARILEMCKKPHKSGFSESCIGAFQAAIRVRFALAVPNQGNGLRFFWRLERANHPKL